MSSQSFGYIPVLTSESGSCITAENWREVGIQAVSYHLDSLLLKPGVDLLKQIKNIKEYLGWTGSLILNGHQLKANRDGDYSITSPFDGSKIKFSTKELIGLLKHLKPDVVILPRKFMMYLKDDLTHWPEGMVPYFCADDLVQLNMAAVHGVYFDDDNVMQLDQWSHLSRYVIGDYGLEDIQKFKSLGVEYIESDRPAHDAAGGLMYGTDHNVAIDMPQSAANFRVIKEDCSCPTCSQLFTRAYLHHLLLHTPLLCKRLLVQHNVYCVS